MYNRQNSIIFYAMLLMLLSLFISRAALTAGIVIFASASFFHPELKKHLRNFISSPLLWGMGLLFLLPFVSGLWSEEENEWLTLVRVKLPLLVLPLAFASPFFLTPRQVRILALVFIVLVTAGTCWSMFYYLSDMRAVHEGYLRANTMATPLENDHVRFSWIVNIAFLLALWLSSQYRKRKVILLMFLLLAVWLAVFLHILAARTGLLGLYAGLLLVVLWLALKKARPVYGIVLITAIVLLPLAAWWLLPTFRNKMKYFRYDFGYFSQAHYLPGGNDATRVISLKAGWEVMAANPVTGVGFGDVFAETKKWYDAEYPGMQPQDKILPSSEWLIYGAGCGIPGLLIFTMVLLVPFVIRVRNKWGWWLLNTLVAAGFLFDIGLEVQFGVFIYCFVVLTAWKVCRQ